MGHRPAAPCLHLSGKRGPEKGRGWARVPRRLWLTGKSAHSPLATVQTGEERRGWGGDTASPGPGPGRPDWARSPSQWETEAAGGRQRNPGGQTEEPRIKCRLFPTQWETTERCTWICAWLLGREGTGRGEDRSWQGGRAREWGQGCGQEVFASGSGVTSPWAGGWGPREGIQGCPSFVRVAVGVHKMRRTAAGWC